MSLFKSISGAALALTILSSSAQSGVWDDYSSYDTLYSRGYWRLDLNQHSDGSRSCESRTVNGSDYVFNMFTLSTGDYVIQYPLLGLNPPSFRRDRFSAKNRL